MLSSMLSKGFTLTQQSCVKPTYYFYQYNDNNFRVVLQKGHREKGYELFDEFESKITDDDDINYKKDESLRCATSRARRMVREYALCNDFEYFVTLTVNSANCDRFSLTDCQQKLRKCLKHLKRLNNNFRYLLITEKHVKGGFHFHGFFKGINNNDLTLIDKTNYKSIPYKILTYIERGEKIYSHNYFDKKLGWCTLSKIKNLSRASSYCTKYITKDCIINENGYMYINSRGLKSSNSSRINPISFDSIPCFKKEYDYSITFDIDFRELNQQQKLYLIYNIQDTTLKQKLLENIKSHLLS